MVEKAEIKKAEIILEYQDYIAGPPASPAQLHSAACSNDEVTISFWRQIWTDQIRANLQKFGKFSDYGVGKLFGQFQNLPCIVAGAGPSLKKNAHLLKNRGKMGLVSCLHNFHLLEDLGCPADFYVTLDAGKVVLEEVSEGGTKTPDEYWEMTKDRTLIAFIGSPPELFEKWKGPVFLFNCPVPDPEMMKLFDDIKFNTYVSTGGNVLGAALYLAKGIFGGNPIIFVGADFSFSYDYHFHSFNSKYDKDLGRCLKVPDIFGVKVKTWASYYNFKHFFDYVATIPNLGIWINCTEGGCLGAYNEGNISQIIQMDLKDCLRMYSINEELKEQCENPEGLHRKILF
jgi:hypothetical protein